MNRRGVALLLALWIVVVLSFVGLQAGAFARADAGATHGLETRLQARYLALAGVEHGLAVLHDYTVLYPTNPLLAGDIDEVPEAPSGPPKIRNQKTGIRSLRPSRTSN